MEPLLKVIDTLDDISELHRYLSDFEYVSYDCETTGLTEQDQVIGFSVCAEEDKAFYVILRKWNTQTQTLEQTQISASARITGLLQLLTTKKLIMHNGVFDCKMAESNFKIRLIDSLHTDTMVLAHLLDENRRVGLKELGKQYFGEDSTDEQAEMKASITASGGKLTKDCYELFKGDAYLIGRYGAKDALLTYKLFYQLVPELFEQGLDKFFYEDESMPLLRGPTYQLNTVGLKVDQVALTTLKKQLEAECAEAKDFISAEIANYIQEKYPGTKKANTFNIGASQQLAWLLFGKLGLEFAYLTDGGKAVCKHLGLRLPYTRAAKNDFIATCTNAVGTPIQLPSIVNGKKRNGTKVKEPWAYIAADKRTLAKLAPKYKWIERLLEYQRKNKILNTYIEGIESRVQYGIIRPNFLQTGTTSGRYSSRDPNFQNLPRDDKRIKACITSRPGKVFVGADYSQLEPRVFAYFSKDKRLLEAFKGTDDFYSVIGMEVYDKTDCTPKKEGSPDAFGIKYKRLRDLSKVIALASTYGATAHQLAPTTGKSIEDTQADIENYFERFPGVREMMRDSHNMAKTTGQVTNLFGRPRRMPEAKRITKLYGNKSHGELPYDARNLLNLAVNHRIQSTGASIVNRAAILFHNNCAKLEIKCNIVVQVHDSLVIECLEADAENVSLILEQAMTTAVKLEGIELEAVPRVGRNLADV